MSFLSRVRSRLMPARVRSSIDEEITSHIAEDVERLKKTGMTSSEAWEQALERFGDRQDVVRRLREISNVESGKRSIGGSFLLDMRHAARGLRRSPWFTGLVALVLGLSVSANGVMFSVMKNVIMNTAGVLATSSVVSIYMYYDFLPEGLREQPIHATQYQGLSELDAVQSSAAFRGAYFNLTSDRGSRRLEGLQATPDLMSVAGVAPALGPGFGAVRTGDEKIVVVSWPFFRDQLGGDPGAVGTTLNLNGEPYEIAGVMPEGFEFPRSVDVPLTFRFPSRPDVWVPYNPPERGPSDLAVVARLQPGATIDQLRDQIEALRLEAPENLQQWLAYRATNLQDQAVGPLRPVVGLLLGATALVLLVAAGNVSGVILARAVARKRELAIRFSLGAGRLGIARYLVAESTTLGLTAAAVALPLSVGLSAAVRSWAPPGIPGIDAVVMDGTLTATVVVLSVLVALTCGVTSFLAIGAEPRVDSSRTTGTRSTRRFGSTVVAVEIALTLVLLTSAGVLTRSLSGLMAVDPGFDYENAVTAEITLPESSYPDADRMRGVQRAQPPGESEAAVPRFHRALLERLQSDPAVTAAGVVRPLPMSGQQEATNYWIDGTDDAGDERRPPVIEYTVVSEGYFDAMGIDFVAGEAFDRATQHDGEPVAIVNESLAAMFPDGKAMNRRIKLGGKDAPYPWLRVIGVAADVRRTSMAESSGPELYVHVSQGGYTTLSTMHLVAKGSGDIAPLAAAIRRAVNEIDPSVPLASVVSLEDLVGDSVAQSSFMARLLAGFAAMALLIAGIGLYSVISFNVSTRKREFAVRVALGASERSVMTHIARGTGAVLLAGILLGTTGAVAVGRLLESFLYQVEPVDPLSLAVSAVILSLITVVAAATPVTRAIRVDPAGVLKTE